MRTLLANFPSEQSAKAAHLALVSAGVDERRIRRTPATTFRSLEPENLDEPFDVSPEAAVSPGAERSGSHAAGGAALGSVIGAAVGVVTTPVLGPIGIAAGMGVGAYAGSLIGALSGLEAATVEPGSVASSNGDAACATLIIATVDDDDRQRAQQIVREFGAEVVEDNNHEAERAPEASD